MTPDVVMARADSATRAHPHVPSQIHYAEQDAKDDWNSSIIAASLQWPAYQIPLLGARVIFFEAAIRRGEPS